jgi:ABC-2 type transport system ATP-binding protein
VIAVEGVHKTFDGRPTLAGASFFVSKGETLGLLGPLGAGKSTMLRILATLVPPDEGSVTVGGIPVESDGRAVRRMVGYLPEACGTYPRMTTREHVEFYAGVHGVPSIRRRPLAGELLEVVGLADRANEDAGSLTKAHRRSLALARTLVHDPAVLLLDEPLSGLDPDSRLEVQTLVIELAAIGKTIVVSGRGLDDVEGMCTSLGLLLDGRTVVSGAADAVRDDVAAGLARRRAELLQRPAGP